MDLNSWISLEFPREADQAQTLLSGGFPGKSPFFFLCLDEKMEQVQRVGVSVQHLSLIRLLFFMGG